MAQLLRAVLVVLIATGLTGGVVAQAPSSDPDVRKGVALVEDGDYDGAILLLDNASRRLAGDAGRGRELSTAYLYLGIAYLGKGHEAAARSNFREAVSRLRDLSLSPEKFSPRVIDLVEAAKAELGKAAPSPAASSVPRPSPSSRPSAKSEGGGGGGHKALIIGGAVVAAGAGTALALKGGGDDGGCDTVYESREGLLRAPGDRASELRAGPAGEAGAWYAELSWRESSAAAAAVRSTRVLPADVTLFVYEDNAAGRIVQQGGLVSSALRKAEWQGEAGVVYFAKATLQDGGTTVTYTLTLGGPCK